MKSHLLEFKSNEIKCLKERVYFLKQQISHLVESVSFQESHGVVITKTGENSATEEIDSIYKRLMQMKIYLLGDKKNNTVTDISKKNIFLKKQLLKEKTRNRLVKKWIKKVDIYNAKQVRKIEEVRSKIRLRTALFSKNFEMTPSVKILLQPTPNTTFENARGKIENNKVIYREETVPFGNLPSLKAKEINMNKNNSVPDSLRSNSGINLAKERRIHPLNRYKGYGMDSPYSTIQYENEKVKKFLKRGVYQNL